jgi:hypothetical protein
LDQGLLDQGLLDLLRIKYCSDNVGPGYAFQDALAVAFQPVITGLCIAGCYAQLDHVIKLGSNSSILRFPPQGAGFMRFVIAEDKQPFTLRLATQGIYDYDGHVVAIVWRFVGHWFAFLLCHFINAFASFIKQHFSVRNLKACNDT